MEQFFAIIGLSLLGALLALFIAGTLFTLIDDPSERRDEDKLEER
jgi:hypothetical protein